MKKHPPTFDLRMRLQAGSEPCNKRLNNGNYAIVDSFNQAVKTLFCCINLRIQ
jgi:hypothetical protein